MESRGITKEILVVGLPEFAACLERAQAVVFPEINLDPSLRYTIHLCSLVDGPARLAGVSRFSRPRGGLGQMISALWVGWPLASRTAQVRGCVTVVAVPERLIQDASNGSPTRGTWIEY